MGQRHQIFVKIANPVKHLRLDAKEKKELEAELGTGEFAILAYHNQWLYGRSALHSAIGVLQFAKQFEREKKVDPKSWGAYDCPFTIGGMGADFNTIEKITSGIAFVMNFRPKNNGSKDAGFDKSHYIGKEDEGINFDYTIGDNNDGITIIDLVENKYCFMNINGEADEQKYDVMALPNLKPVDAKKYVACYYGETIATTNPYYFGNHERTLVTMSEADQQKIVNKNIKDNLKVAKAFNKFEVLTKREINLMFKKKVEKTLIEAITKVPKAIDKPKKRTKITLH